MRNAILIAAGLAALPAAASAQVASPITRATVTTATYTQNFNTLANTGSSGTSLPIGWGIVEFDQNADGAYGVSSGTATAGNAYSFGSTNSTDRALGALTSGTLSPVVIGALFSNGLATTITSLALAFTGEQWRAASANSLVLEYSTNATTLQNGTWIRASAFDFLSPVTAGSAGALDGNLAANRRDISGTIGNLSIAAGGGFGFRWTMTDATGSDPALAIDDLSFTANAAGAVPEPATWAMMIAGFALVGAALRRRAGRPALA